MSEKDPIEYSPEELAEIQRVVSLLPGSSNASEDGGVLSLASAPEEVKDPALEQGYRSFSELLDDSGDEPVADEVIEELPGESIIDLGDEITELGDEELTFAPQDEMPEDFGEVPSFDTLPETDETDQFADLAPIEGEDDFSISEGTELPDIPDFDGVESVDENSFSRGKGASENSTLGQLDALLADEPESVDAQDISSDTIIDADEALDDSFEGIQQAENPVEDDFGMADFSESPEMSLDGGTDDTLPDMSDLDFGEAEIPETDELDIPDVDLGGLGGFELPDDDSAAVEVPEQAMGEEANGLPDFGELDDFGGTPAGGAEDSVIDDFSSGDLDLGDLGTPEPVGEIPSINIEPLGHEDDFFGQDDDLPDIPAFTGPAGETTGGEEQESRGSDEPVDLSDDELRRLKKALALYPAGLMYAVRDAVLKDMLKPADTRQLVDMILDNRPEDNIRRFLEKKLNRKIDPNAVPKGQRRVVVSRSEYTPEGRARQQALFKRTRIAAVGALVILAASTVSYIYIYRPWMGKRLINQGAELIRRDADPKIPDYEEAERLFGEAEEYVPDFLYGYNEYSRAYFDRREFGRSLEKLNKAYSIDAADIDTLLNLGYFYSRIDDGFFRSIKPKLREFYYNKVPPVEPIRTQLDVAIDFYRKVLSLDNNNINAMYGIGNAYFYQKQYLKARQYFENILKVDEDSVVGYSGLLNLFIERDDLPEAVLIYVNLRDKDLLADVPSPLLAKLAGYFLDKSPTVTNNVRIDYGIRSPRLKDEGDNMFPAVLQVLGALMAKDPDYPPLYLQYAKYAEKQGNLKLMQNYLDSAIDHAESAGYGYFGAYHMMGEFYYKTNQPVRAYTFLQKALKAWANPAPFMREDFYRETEHPGRTYAVMGNIFYYNFDKVRMMTGDQEQIEDELVENDPDKMANFLVARKKYEKALELDYESSELHYNLGRIYYLNRDYSASLDQWLNLYDDFTRSPELMLALGNVFYRNGNLEASKAQYKKVINLFELQAEKIRVVAPEKASQVKIFETLTTAYNNLGVVYQKQNNEAAGSVAYWKSIDYAKRIEKESELARVNLARAFKEREKQPEPIFDDNLPYSIDIYREEQRQGRS